MKKALTLLPFFKNPLFVLFTIIFYLMVNYGLHQPLLAIVVVLAGVIVGSYQMLKETAETLLSGNFVIDYIAILVLVVSLATQQWLVAAVIVLMLSSGRTLETYGMERAKGSLTALANRIPHDVFVVEADKSLKKTNIDKVHVGEHILIRKGEIIPLDGLLVSDTGITDESSLTGEPYEIEKQKGDQIRSGTLNIGNPLEIKVTKRNTESTYYKIIQMVKSAQQQKAPLIRLADKYSTLFTIVSLAIAALAFIVSHGNFQRVLSVLVIATPCPLLLATPIALLGGMNAAAKRRIIVKNLGALEALSRVNTLIFDKTGTITLGMPSLEKIEVFHSSLKEKDILAIAEAIERNSLHPFAKALVHAARQQKAPFLTVSDIHEEVGKGISGKVEGKTYLLAKTKDDSMGIEMTENDKKVAYFQFQDTIKSDTKDGVSKFKEEGLEMHVFTGDKQKAADKIVQQLGQAIHVKAECTPEDKKNGILAFKNEGKTVAMVGDGLNDAPALALADVGMVFSNQEHTAASEAADIVFLGGDFASVSQTLSISRRTIRIALQSIFFGIGLSIVGMLFASVGFIPPIAGAIIQEGIDVAVILNALRASR